MRRKAAVLDTTRRVCRTPPGSESGACAHGGNAGTWESQRSPCGRSEEGVLTINKSPGNGWDTPACPASRERRDTKDRGVTRYRETSESEGTRDGLLAVAAEHSTDELMTTVREGGEPRPKGPTVGKVKPGITFCLEET